MALAAVALLPSIVRGLNNIGSDIPRMTIADLVTGNKSGYDLTVAPTKILTLDFREPTPVAAALASDCGRLSCAAFQSAANIEADISDRDNFAWGLLKLYYASFYAGHALIRTLGEGCSFFYKRHTDQIAKVADALGILPPLRVDAGLYHCVLSQGASAVTFQRAGSTSGGSHEAFWLVFGNKLRAIAAAVLTGPLPSLDASAVFSQIDAMLQIANRRSGYCWLSVVRNELQYRLQHRAWFPETVKIKDRRDLARIVAQWKRDPMSINLGDQRWGLLGDFSLACTFIISLCRDVFRQIAERSTKGKHSFARTGPVAFLSDIGIAL